MLAFHFIGLAMGLGTGFAHAFLGSAAKKMSPDEAIKFKLHSLVLVAVLIVLIALINIAGKKAKRGDAERQFKKAAVLGKLTLIVALAIVIVAVGVFR